MVSLGDDVVGVGSLHPVRPGDAEFALTVADRAQDHGLGTLLLEALLVVPWLVDSSSSWPCALDERPDAPPGGRLGIYGFGASAHLTAQIAIAQGRRCT